MKISFKLFLLTTIVTLLSFTLFGIFSYQRDFKQFIDDMKIDASTLGHTLLIEIENILASDNLSSVTGFLDKVNKEEHLTKARWVWLGKNTESNFQPQIDYRKILAHEHENENIINFIELEQKPYLYTYVIIDLADDLHGAVELYENLSPVINQFFQNNTIHLGIMVIILLVLNSLIIGAGGYIMLTKRINRIINYIDGISFSKNIDIIKPMGNDEISRITHELNNMCLQINKSRKRLIKEKDEKIKLVEQLNHKDRLAVIGQLASGIAHELGTPLNVISGRGKLIINGESTSVDVKDNAQIIINQCNHITNMIKSVLTFARRKPIEKSMTSVNKVIENVIAMFETISENKKITLEYIKPTEEIILNIDAVQIQQVFSNLILNSIEAIPESGKIKIGICLKDHNKTKQFIRIYIKDNGSGIPEKNINHIFEPFFTTKNPGKGTGLGLSITYNIIKEHGGYIKVRNNKKKGCCFSIYLPYSISLALPKIRRVPKDP